MITQAELQARFEYRNGHLYWKEAFKNARVRPGDRAGCQSTKYWTIKINQKCYYAHRLIWLYHYGNLPEIIDHINRVPNDNRIENLRVASKQENAVNTYNKQDPRRGTYFRSDLKKWTSQIRLGKSVLSLGLFTSQSEAKAAYDAIAAHWYGDFY
jgi:hypothetical protein